MSVRLRRSTTSGFAEAGGATFVVPTAQLGTGTASSSTFLRGDQSWVLPSSSTLTFHGAYVYRSTGTVNGVQTYDSEVWDTDNFHSTVSNTSRLTIPAGYTNAYWLLIAAGRSASAPNPNNPDSFFQKNGAEYGGRNFETFISGGHFVATCASMIVQGSTGDYFEFNYAEASGSGMAGGALDGANEPSFQIALLGV